MNNIIIIDGISYIFEIFLNTYPLGDTQNIEIFKINPKIAYLYRRSSNSYLLCYYNSTETDNFTDILDYLNLKYGVKNDFS